MALKPIIDTLEGLPEQIAGEYVETDDGRYRLNVTASDGWALENVAALRTALESNKHKRQQLAEQLSRFQDDDGNLLDVQELLGARKQLDELRNGKQEEVEDIVKQRIAEVVKKHETSAAKQAEALAALESDLDHSVRVQAAIDAIGKAGVSKYQKVLLDPVLKHLAMQRGDDGRPRAVVVGPDGAPRISPNGGTGDMSIDELLGEMREDEAFSVMFNGSGASGSGAPQPGAPGQGAFRLSREDLRDQSKYAAAKKAAQEAGQKVQII